MISELWLDSDHNSEIIIEIGGDGAGIRYCGSSWPPRWCTAAS